MTSNTYFLRKSKSVAPQRRGDSSILECNKNKNIRNPKSSTDIKKLSSTYVDLPMDTRRTACGPQSSLDGRMDTSVVNEDVDFPGFTDMEDEAFQLASYVESDAPFDEIMSKTQKKNRQNVTSTNDLRVENISMSDASLDELLDISINELQKATNPCNANTSISVTFQSSRPNQIKRSPNGNASINNVYSARSNENIYAGSGVNVGGIRSGGATTYNIENHQSNSSDVNGIFGDQSSSISTHGRAFRKSGATHQSMLKNRATLSHSNGVVGWTPYTTLTKNVALKQNMFHLFNRPCYNYLTGRCNGGVCKWNHSLPPARDVYRKLMLLNDDTVKYMYSNFVLRTEKAFLTYFPTMCEVLGKRKMKPILVEAISKCEERENVAFIKYIFNGLLLNGLTKMEAITTVTDRCSKSRQCYDVLLEIMIETDALYFVDPLKDFSHLYGTIRTETMYKLLQQVVNAPGTALLSVFIEILDKYSMCRTFDENALDYIMPRAANLVKGNLNLTQRLNHIVNRTK